MSFTTKQKKLIYTKTDGKCYLCGKPLPSLHFMQQQQGYQIKPHCQKNEWPESNPW